MKLKFKKIFLTLAATASLIIPVSLTSCSDNNQTSNKATISQNNSPNQPTEGNSGSSDSGNNTGGNSSSNPSNPSNAPSQSTQSNDGLPKLNTPLDNSLGLPITPDDDPNGYTNVRVMEECGWNEYIYNPIILKVINKYCDSNFTSDNIVTAFSGYDPKYFTNSEWSESENNYYIDDENNCPWAYTDETNNVQEHSQPCWDFLHNLDEDQKKQLMTIENTTWHKIFSTYYVVVNSDKPLFDNVVDTKDNNAVVKDCIWLIKNTKYQYLIKLNVASKPWNLGNLYFTPVDLKIDENGNLFNDETSKPKEILINLNAEGAKDDYYYQPTLFPIYLKYDSDGSLNYTQNFDIVCPIVDFWNASPEVTPDEINHGKASWSNYVLPIYANTINPFQGWWDETPYDYYGYDPNSLLENLENSVTKTNLLNLFEKIDSKVSDLNYAINFGIKGFTTGYYQNTNDYQYYLSVQMTITYSN